MIVGILSMQKVDNLGSLLQAYGLKKVLESLGSETEFMDIKKIDEDYNLSKEHAQDFSGELETKGLTGLYQKLNKYFAVRIRNKLLNIKQKRYFDEFRIKQLEIYRKNETYDICVIGSDEVFNCLNAAQWGYTSQLFGNIPEAGKIITYAASCGETRYQDLPYEIEKRIRNTFQNIDSFSVRDSNTSDFVSRLTDKTAKEHLDPALIYDFKDELRNVKIPVKMKRYCIIYSYRNRIHEKRDIENIKSFCRRHQLTPVAVGASQFWIHEFAVCPPFECLKLFQYADFVITDTFHGTIFSIQYADRFAVLIKESNQNKLMDLVVKIGLEQHLINDMNELEKAYCAVKDKNRIDEKIKIERKKTKDYLREALL